MKIRSVSSGYWLLATFSRPVGRWRDVLCAVKDEVEVFRAMLFRLRSDACYVGDWLAAGTKAMTQEPWLTWFRVCSESLYGVRVCHIFQRILSHRWPRHRNAAA